MKSNGFLAALLWFATGSMHLHPQQAIWEIPMAQLCLLIRQRQLESDPQHAWTFSDEAFIEKLRKLGI